MVFIYVDQKLKTVALQTLGQDLANSSPHINLHESGTLSNAKRVQLSDSMNSDMRKNVFQT